MEQGQDEERDDDKIEIRLPDGEKVLVARGAIKAGGFTNFPVPQEKKQ